MPMRFYKEGDSIQINNLDDPYDMVGSVLKENGELKFYPLPGHEKHTWAWIDDKYGYRMADVMAIAAMVMEMPECFWVALGEFADCDRAGNKGNQ